MYLKYNTLGLIGKIWCIREEISLGIIFKNEECFSSAIEKLEEIIDKYNDKINSEIIYNFINNTKNLQLKHIYEKDIDLNYVKQQDVISKIWSMSAKLGYLKFKLHNEKLEEKDIYTIYTILNTIKKIQAQENENRNLTAKDRRDLHYIYYDVVDFIDRFKKADKTSSAEINL